MHEVRTCFANCKRLITAIAELLLGPALEKNGEKSGRKNLRQICLVCGAENEAEEAICNKCGRPLGTPQLSKKRNILEIIAVFAFFIALIFLLVLFFKMYLFPG